MMPKSTMLSSVFARWTLVLICLGSFLLMLSASRTDSAIMDELAHIPAGYGYVHNLDYRLNPEHPPLVKALAEFPVLFLQPNFPTNNPAWTTALNGQWDMGTSFLYQSGNDPDAIVRTSRIMPMLLTILTIIFIYLLALSLMGEFWALLPAFLFAFDPSVLAHGHYVTTDIGAAFGVIFSLYFFLKFVETPSTKHLWFAGLAFGVAQIAKFSMPLVTILFIFLTLVLWLRDAVVHHRVTARSFRRFWHLLLIIVIGYVFVVYPVYFLFTVNYPIAKQASETTTLLGSFADGPTPAGQFCHGMRCLADLDIWMAGNPVLRPFGEYLLGLLMVFQRSTGGNTIYYLGHIVNAGGWTYFPVLFLIKEPIPTILLVVLAFLLTAAHIIRKKSGEGRIKRMLDYLGTNFAEFSLASFIVLYWAYSMRSPLNIGLRHVIPTLPLIFILTGGVIKRWVMRMNSSRNGMSANADLASLLASVSGAAKAMLTSSLKYIFLLALLVWLGFETLFAAPYFLSYFNELGGGIQGGYHFVTDSNYDWGQDMLRLRSFVEARPEIDKIAVNYFGGGSPQYYLGAKQVDWWPAKGNPADQNIHWLAVSINQLQGGLQPLAGDGHRNASDTYDWLTTLRPISTNSETLIGGTMGNVPPPDYRVGTSIFIYKL